MGGGLIGHNVQEKISLRLRMLAIYRLTPARAAARTLLLCRYFRQCDLSVAFGRACKDVIREIARYIVQDGDDYSWEPLLEKDIS